MTTTRLRLRSRETALRRPRRRHRRGAAAARGGRRSRSIAGRETMSAGSRIRTGTLGGGMAATGNYPGKARTPDELRARRGEGAVADSRARTASTCTPSTASSASGASIATRSARSISPAGSTGRSRSGSDSTSTRHCFRIRRRPTISRSRIPTRRSASFWIRHAAACRRIGAAMGKALGTPCVTNVWIPDGMKDTPVDRVGPRQRLTESLDAVFAEPLDPRAQPGCGRGQAVRPRLRELHRRLARVLSRLRPVAPAFSTRSTPATIIRPKRSPTRSARS